jgi:hypothetical protein
MIDRDIPPDLLPQYHCDELTRLILDKWKYGAAEQPYTFEDALIELVKAQWAARQELERLLVKAIKEQAPQPFVLKVNGEDVLVVPKDSHTCLRP